ncbi:hyaluronidase A-like [Copidosoma floridanum]|uniref:hyaluronidase A-like n=1 Tax=Copidosoma floridanum TaxID=29053 RepID=UPI0006C96AC8|nr:hyaluronidase A-like [Copidosoma floridanum]
MSNTNWLPIAVFVPLVLGISTSHLLGKSPIKCDGDPFASKFQVYWNVPTDECLRHDVSFEGLTDDFCVVQNTNDKFRGDKIAILYDPGSFPTLKDDYDRHLERNGGVPQNGNLTGHLVEFQRDVDTWIPDANFSGAAVIDFELWRPIYRQLWGKYEIYKNMSVRLEQRKHGDWHDKDMVNEEAERSYERAAREFLRRTLEFAQTIRPRAKWGYYDYPFCNNWSSRNRHDHCPDTIVKENDQMSWLYENMSLLLPSVYLSPDLDADQRLGLVRGRVQEAVRIANKSPNRGNVKVLPYYWYRYRKNNTFVEKTELKNTLEEVARNGGDGVVIWGMRDDINSRGKCEDFLNYVWKVLGPVVLEVKAMKNTD